MTPKNVLSGASSSSGQDGSNAAGLWQCFAHNVQTPCSSLVLGSHKLVLQTVWGREVLRPLWQLGAISSNPRPICSMGNTLFHHLHDIQPKKWAYFFHLAPLTPSLCPASHCRLFLRFLLSRFDDDSRGLVSSFGLPDSLCWWSNLLHLQVRTVLMR